MTDFGACKSCGRVYPLTRLKACPRCGDVETASIEEVRIPPTTRSDLSYAKPVVTSKRDIVGAINRILPTTTSCNNCGRDFRSDKLDRCPRCGNQEQILPTLQNVNSIEINRYEENKCSSCKKTFPLSFDFCPGCGQKTNAPRVEIREQMELPPKVETYSVSIPAESMSLSAQRRAKTRKSRSIVFSTLGAITLLIVVVLIAKSFSSGSYNPSNEGGNIGSDSKHSSSYSLMFKVGVNFARISGPSDSAESQCTRAKSTGVIQYFGRPMHLGQQYAFIQSHLRTAEGFRGCIDGFNSL